MLLAAEAKPLRIFVNTQNPIPPYLWVDACTKSLEGSAVKLLEKSLKTLDISAKIITPDNSELPENKVAAFDSDLFDAAFVSGTQSDDDSARSHRRVESTVLARRDR